MSYHCLSCNLRKRNAISRFFVRLSVLMGEEFQLPGCRNMGDMQTGTKLAGQFHCELAALIACLFAAYFRMMLHGRILSVLSLSLRHVAVDDSGILTVRHHRQIQFLSRLEDALQ